MNVRVDFPPELVDEIVAAVTARVLAEIADAAPHPPASPYLSVAEAAELLRCSRQRVDDLLSSRRLTRVKEGRRTLIRRDEIEAHLQTGRNHR